MHGSTELSSRWPRPREVALRLLLCAAVLVPLLLWAQRPIVSATAPFVRATTHFLEPAFVISDIAIAPSGASSVVAIRANLAKPTHVDEKIVYPLGWRGSPAGWLSVSYTVGGALVFPVLVLLIVASWPTKSLGAAIVQVLFGLVFGGILLVGNLSITYVAELWKIVYDAVSPGTNSNWMVLSRFLLGGGGFLVAFLLASLAIACGRLIVTKRRSVSVRNEGLELSKTDVSLRENSASVRSS